MESPRVTMSPPLYNLLMMCASTLFLLYGLRAMSRFRDALNLRAAALTKRVVEVRGLGESLGYLDRTIPPHAVGIVHSRQSEPPKDVLPAYVPFKLHSTVALPDGSVVIRVWLAGPAHVGLLINLDVEGARRRRFEELGQGRAAGGRKEDAWARSVTGELQSLCEIITSPVLLGADEGAGAGGGSSSSSSSSSSGNGGGQGQWHTIRLMPVVTGNGAAPRRMVNYAVLVVPHLQEEQARSRSRSRSGSFIGSDSGGGGGARLARLSYPAPRRASAAGEVSGGGTVVAPLVAGAGAGTEGDVELGSITANTAGDSSSSASSSLEYRSLLPHSAAASHPEPSAASASPGATSVVERPEPLRHHVLFALCVATCTASNSSNGNGNGSSPSASNNDKDKDKNKENGANKGVGEGKGKGPASPPAGEVVTLTHSVLCCSAAGVVYAAHEVYGHTPQFNAHLDLVADPVTGAVMSEGACKDEKKEEDAGEGGDDGENECTVCLVEVREVLLLPCRHLCVCLQCFAHIERCPICRMPFERYVTIAQSAGPLSKQIMYVPAYFSAPVGSGGDEPSGTRRRVPPTRYYNYLGAGTQQ